jgi:D-3-phosphoglycerate dehydrogenase
MTFMLPVTRRILLSQTTATTTNASVATLLRLRSLSTAVGATGHSVEHFASGWKNLIADMDDFFPGSEGKEHQHKYSIQTFNKISPLGLAQFPASEYDITPADADKKVAPANALLLRSHKLSLEEVDVSVRAIARCGAGTNNIPVAELTQRGIPVFNTPGANANAVKELILCGLLLGSRKIVKGINHMKALGEQGLARERVGT